METESTWEYVAFQAYAGGGKLNDLGADGWELVSVDQGIAYMKHRVSEWQSSSDPSSQEPQKAINILREKLAGLVHEQWRRWVRNLLEACHYIPDGSVMIPDEILEQWKWQSTTPHPDLPYKEQDINRIEAYKILEAIGKLEFRLGDYRFEQGSSRTRADE